MYQIQTWRWLYSSTDANSSPVSRLNLEWSAFLGTCFVLNTSRRLDCRIQEANIPLIPKTVDWPSSYVLPLSSSMRLEKRSHRD